MHPSFDVAWLCGPVWLYSVISGCLFSVVLTVSFDCLASEV